MFFFFSRVEFADGLTNQVTKAELIRPGQLRARDEIAVALPDKVTPKHNTETTADEEPARMVTRATTIAQAEKQMMMPPLLEMSTSTGYQWGMILEYSGDTDIFIVAVEEGSVEK